MIAHPIYSPVLFLIAGSGVLAFFWPSRKEKTSARDLYMQALQSCVDGKMDEAVERLKKTVEQDSSNIMAYIQLGNIYRNKGNAVRAAKIHKNLLVRGDLKNTEMDIIFKALLLDYSNAQMLDKAIEIAERIIHRNKRDMETKSLLLSLYEQKGDWDKAFFYRQNINKWTKKEESILAMYKIYSGKALVEKGVEREGRIRFREAIKLDKQCIPAYLFWGDSYKREGRNEDAVRVWRELTTKNVKHAYLAYGRLKEVLFDLGRYGEIEEIYQQVLRKNPKDPMTLLHLAEFHRKQGDMDEALALCRKVLEINTRSRNAQHLLIQLLRNSGRETEALDEALALLDKSTEAASYHCSYCNHASEEPQWRCPQCHRWNSYLT